MSAFNHEKYSPFTPVAIKNRRWPDNTIKTAPQWCSVDLRDGNQALIEPMSVAQKKQLFQLLVDTGFKEIEVGFPAASQPDFDFVRWLIENNKIPEDVTIQVLTQARPELIKRTFEAVAGSTRTIIHMYNSTSKIQREQVFRLERASIIDVARKGAVEIRQCAEARPETEWVFQYSPESFTATEPEFAVEICDAVTAIWEPVTQGPIIINLPATVEMASPNIYADQIEWFLGHVARRDLITLSVHTHNDRGCAVAAAELAVMAGADRVEGTLLGNGERTGNMDIITMAMNLYSQGIDPGLNLSDMDGIIKCVKECTQLPVHPRHPYVGDLVFTAFSGSHQDAIKKCLALRTQDSPWEVAYLPIDPADLGRSYQEIIRVNSQSGKGGIAYVLEHNYGFQLPRWLQIEFSSVVQARAEDTGSEVEPSRIWEIFESRYLQNTAPCQLENFSLKRKNNDHFSGDITHAKGVTQVQGEGNGTLAAFINGLEKAFDISMQILEYHEHALSQGTGSEAVAYMQVKCNNKRYSGIAVHEDIVTASFNALLSALNQFMVYQTTRAA